MLELKLGCGQADASGVGILKICVVSPAAHWRGGLPLVPVSQVLDHIESTRFFVCG